MSSVWRVHPRAVPGLCQGSITWRYACSSRFDPSTGLVGNSYAQFLPSDVGHIGHLLLKLLATLKLVTLDTNIGTKGEMRVSNLTIINFVLRFVGPTHERTLVIYMLTIQVGTAIFERAAISYPVSCLGSELLCGFHYSLLFS